MGGLDVRLTTMTVFLDQPRYWLGCIGFFTSRYWGTRILWIGAAISLVAVLVSAFSWIALDAPRNVAQALFLVVSAWLIVLVLMRLFWTGAMWVFTQVFDWISECIPKSSGTMDFLRRAYWIVIEIFLSIGFIGLLMTAIPVGLGALTIDEPEGEVSARQPATRSESKAQ
jgi:hypothetical protein